MSKISFMFIWTKRLLLNYKYPIAEYFLQKSAIRLYDARCTFLIQFRAGTNRVICFTRILHVRTARKHVQNPLWNPFAHLRRTLMWFMVYFCMPIQLCRYYDIGIIEIYKMLKVIPIDRVFHFPIFYYLLHYFALCRNDPPVIA